MMLRKFLLIIILFNSVVMAGDKKDTQNTQDTQPVDWSQDSISITLAPGESIDVPVTLSSAKRLGHVELSVTKDLLNLVTVTPKDIKDVRVSDVVKIIVRVKSQSTTPLGSYNGIVQISADTKGKGKSFSFTQPLPVNILIQNPDTVPAADNDGNGVWDYMDIFIQQKYTNSPPTQAAARQLSRALQTGLLNADDKRIAMEQAGATDRAVECMFFVQPPKDAARIISELEGAIVNNAARSRAYVTYGEQLAGEVFPGQTASQFSNSCNEQ
ncbi:hypothetical protein [Pseudomonas akapageensis]|uniref:hypothetical protein n=1 Tax=Pseudomonas akapageensis TaxID=2609961 RepID=UPI00140D0DF5|nr:hypothetical protein [Pseudomonas akapageensis]